MDELRLKYLRETVQLWDALAEHPEWYKYQAAYSKQNLRHIVSYVNLCPTCEYANTGINVDCDKCAIEEWRVVRCFQEGPFCEWRNARTNKTRSKCAKAIADLARENIERIKDE